MASKQGETAFLCACDAGNYELARLLLEKEGRSTLRTGETGLHLAARSGCKAIVELLLEPLCRKQTKAGKTALMYAASAGNLEIVMLLLEKEVGYQDTDGRTATMNAILNGHEGCMTALLPHEKEIVDKRADCSNCCSEHNAQCNVLPCSCFIRWNHRSRNREHYSDTGSTTWFVRYCWDSCSCPNKLN